MQYQVRQIIRVTEQRHTDSGQRRCVSTQQVNYLPARDKADATRTVENLDGGRMSDYWREGGCEYSRSFDVVCVCYISDGKKLTLTESDIQMIAGQYSQPEAIAAE